LKDKFLNGINRHLKIDVFSDDLVREYNSFYQAVSILGEEDLQKKIFRVQLSKKVADTIALAFQLLGIDVPENVIPV